MAGSSVLLGLRVGVHLALAHIYSYDSSEVNSCNGFTIDNSTIKIVLVIVIIILIVYAGCCSGRVLVVVNESREQCWTDHRDRRSSPLDFCLCRHLPSTWKITACSGRTTVDAESSLSNTAAHLDAAWLMWTSMIPSPWQCLVAMCTGPMLGCRLSNGRIRCRAVSASCC